MFVLRIEGAAEQYAGTFIRFTTLPPLTSFWTLLFERTCKEKEFEKEAKQKRIERKNGRVSMVDKESFLTLTVFFGNVLVVPHCWISLDG
jgi:hypothetical protein